MFGSSDPTPTPSAEVATTTPAEVDPATEPVIEDPTTPEEAPGADLSLVDACMTLAEPLQEANTAMMGLAQASQDDPQVAVDMWRALSEAFADFGETVKNAEVATLPTAVGTTGNALTDLLQRIYVHNDLSAMGEFTETNDAFFAAYEELLGLCDTNG